MKFKELKPLIIGQHVTVFELFKDSAIMRVNNCILHTEEYSMWDDYELVRIKGKAAYGLDIYVENKK